MDSSPGARLATLLLGAFDAMVAQVVADLEERGHPGVTATLEFALAAIADGAQDASALGRRLGVSKQAAAKTIATLEQLGYVHRESDPKDARRKVLAVTSRGRDMTAIGAARFDELRRRWSDAVGPERVAQVEAALAVLADGERP
ncbi:MarR family winged helix-turn-helix transcriptional regulator [Nocardioides lianchengensis]|uniref:DNA-binding transcriptional regulator, MarR family n=1 Tax=Nocardioides lianchengensis TaxID=1045774 RepID=A0A1G7A0H7_9ACTN|nr:MarR family transcriptional regulator [Nocardioides lianchengensis]NYG12310.1 DNA-binding MarR family transcriptional regulator [Nocardioides lianchengensis]SDE08414.1 DNA-binding transcriptional regulator, MarR family [Nocardioides lianchengensis]